MSDQSPTVLYVLTTLAQSCAALAAFVGAIGVFRVQMLREQRIDAEREFQEWTHRLTNTDMLGLPFEEVRRALADYPRTISLYFKKATDAQSKCEAFVPLLHRTRLALLVLEAWNLAIIGVALIGFNYVPALARAPWFSCALVVVAVVTALVPFGCVIVWTRGVEK